MFFRRRYILESANVQPVWMSTEWREWECPRNVVAGESFHGKQLQALTGAPRQWGYLIPVEATLIRERSNPYDANAWRVEVGGVEVGHLRRPIAAQLSALLDKVGCSTFTVCALLRGGEEHAPNVGCHLWLNRRTTPGPKVVFDDDTWSVAWPPYDSEGRA